MKATSTIKTLAVWVLTVISPYAARIWRRGDEQRVPLVIAVVILTIGTATLGIGLLAITAWLVSRFS